MRGELDDALARLRKWDEVRQKLAGENPQPLPEPAEAGASLVPEAAQAPPPVPGANPHPVSGPPQGSGGAAAQQAGQVSAEPAPPAPTRAVEDVVNAIADAMRRHAGTAVGVTIEDETSSWTVHIVPGEDGQPVITRLHANHIQPAGAAGSAGQWPVEGDASAEPAHQAQQSRSVEQPRPGERRERTASRLAALVRRDPSLLDPPSDHHR